MTRRDPPDPARLDPNLRRAMDARMADGTDADAALVARVKARVLQQITGDPAAGLETVRAAQGEWTRVAPGIERKALGAIPGAPALWRIAPGACVPPHAHDADEECLVLEGSVRIGAGLVLHAGDYHLARKGSAHHAVGSDTGAVVYLRGVPSGLGG